MLIKLLFISVRCDLTINKFPFLIFLGFLKSFVNCLISLPLCFNLFQLLFLLSYIHIGGGKKDWKLTIHLSNKKILLSLLILFKLEILIELMIKIK